MPDAKLIRVAPSVLTLRDQLNRLAPGRSKESDGFIGNAAHQARPSDHNPEWRSGSYWWVTAGDFTHDPAGGLDCQELAIALAEARDPRVKYAIWNRGIMAGRLGPKPWQWRKYEGDNPHVKHLHLSVVREPMSLTDTPWNLGSLMDVDKVWSYPINDRYHPGRVFRAADALDWAAYHGGANRDILDGIVKALERIEARLAEMEK